VCIFNCLADCISLLYNKQTCMQTNKQVLVLAPVRDPPAMEHYGAQLPLPSMQLPFRGEYSFSYALSDCVSQRLTEFKPDIMHIATPDLVASQVQQWAIDRNIPVVCSYHTRFTSYLPYYFKGVTLDAIDNTIWWWLRKFHQRCDHIYPPTQGVANELIAQGFPKEAMRLWPRGVNLTLYVMFSYFDVRCLCWCGCVWACARVCARVWVLVCVRRCMYVCVCTYLHSHETLRVLWRAGCSFQVRP
jgi:phosphatidylinositol alpha 1,6-mannosyltransferase